MALGGGGHRALHAAPGHDGGVGGKAALEDLVPANHPPASAVDMLLGPLDEPALQPVLVLDAQGLDLGLDLGTGLPLVLDRLVAADMDIGRGKQVHHLVEHVVEEGERRFRGLVEIGKHPPVAHGLARRGLGHAKLRIGHQRRQGVARHLDLGDDGDPARGGIGDEAAHLVLSIEAAVAGGPAGLGIAARRAGRHAPGAFRGQLRVLLDLQPPALIVDQVPVQDIELVGGHGVEDRLDRLDALEVAGAVQHEAAPGEAGRVVDADGRQQSRALGRVGHGQLPDADRAIEQAGALGSGDDDAGRVDVEVVGLGRVAGCGSPRQHDGGLAGGRRALGDGQLQASGLEQHVGQLPRHHLGLDIALGDKDPGLGGEGEGPLPQLRPGRRGGEGHGRPLHRRGGEAGRGKGQDGERTHDGGEGLGDEDHARALTLTGGKKRAERVTAPPQLRACSQEDLDCDRRRADRSCGDPGPWRLRCNDLGRKDGTFGAKPKVPVSH